MLKQSVVVVNGVPPTSNSNHTYHQQDKVGGSFTYSSKYQVERDLDMLMTGRGQ